MLSEGDRVVPPSLLDMQEMKQRIDLNQKLESSRAVSNPKQESLKRNAIALENNRRNSNQVFSVKKLLKPGSDGKRVTLIVKADAEGLKKVTHSDISSVYRPEEKCQVH